MIGGVLLVVPTGLSGVPLLIPLAAAVLALEALALAAVYARYSRAFAATNPKVQAPARAVDLDVTPGDYYQDPAGHARRLYEEF